MEQFKNNATTTLSAGINSSITSVPVNSNAGFPTVAQFRILIDSELMLVTAGAAGTTWTVTRAIENTIAASHLVNASVIHLITAGAVQQFRSDNIPTSSAASLPANTQAGILCLTTDSPFAYRDTGASWTAFAPLYELVSPIDSNYSWVNQGGASVNVVNGGKGGIFLQDPHTNGGVRMRVKTIPATPYTVTIGCILSIAGSENLCGMVLRESSSGKLILFGVDSFNLCVLYYNNPTSSAGTLYTSIVPFYNTAPMLWLRISDDGANRKYFFCCDGVNFMQVATDAHNAFPSSTMVADQIGFYAWAVQTNFTAAITVLHWKETSP